MDTRPSRKGTFGRGISDSGSEDLGLKIKELKNIGSIVQWIPARPEKVRSGGEFQIPVLKIWD